MENVFGHVTSNNFDELALKELGNAFQDSIAIPIPAEVYAMENIFQDTCWVLVFKNAFCYNQHIFGSS